MLIVTTSLLRTVVAVAALFCSTGAASANWITIKNDSGKPIATSKEPNTQTALFEKLARTVIEKAEATKTKQRPTITIAD